MVDSALQCGVAMKGIPDLTGDEQSFWDHVFCQVLQQQYWSKGRSPFESSTRALEGAKQALSTTVGPEDWNVKPKKSKSKPAVQMNWLRTAGKHADYALEIRRRSTGNRS